MIPDATLEEIRERARADIVGIIGERLELRRSGSRWVARCPFHDDRNPSLSINPEGYWKCFGCGAGGDPFTFLMEDLSESFQGVVRILADRYHIDIDDDLGQDSRERLKAALAAAADYFGRNLRTMPEAEPARAILTARGFDINEAISRFGCGFAPPGYETTLAHLRRNGFTPKELEAAGLASTNSTGKTYSFFRNRLTWVIRSSFGAPIGFGARRLDDDKDSGPKYINSRETPLYKKSQALYGLSTARDAIKKTGQVNIVEGYTDVMAMHIAGVTNTVAACGTALGIDHLKALSLIVGDDGEITTAMDDDDAGRRSVLAIYEKARSAGLRQRLSVLPPTSGLDPDDYRRAYGDEALADLPTRRRPIIETIIDRTLAAAPRESIEDRRAALDQVTSYLSHVTDPIVRGEYTRRVSEDLGFRTTEVEDVLGPIAAPSDDPPPTNGSPHSSTRRPPAATPSPSQRSHLLERDILATIVTTEDLCRAHRSKARDTFTADASQAVLDVIDKALDDPAPQAHWSARLVTACGDNVAAQQATYALLAMPLLVHPDQIDNHVHDLFAALDAAQAEETIADLRQKLQTTTDPDVEAQLLGWIMQLSESPVR